MVESPSGTMRPFVLGITGISSAGKSTVCNALSKRFAGQATLVALDDFYWPGPAKAESDGIINYDHPDKIDFDTFVETLRRQIAQVSAQLVPGSAPTERPFIIVEGFLILHNPEARELIDDVLFLKISREEALRRRLVRVWPVDYIPEPTNYFDKYVWPMYQQFGSALDGDGSTFARPVIHEIEAEVSPETLAADVTAVCERLLAIER